MQQQREAFQAAIDEAGGCKAHRLSPWQLGATLQAARTAASLGVMEQRAKVAELEA